MEPSIPVDSASSPAQIPFDPAAMRSLTTPWLAVSLGLFSKVANARLLNEQPEDLSRATAKQLYRTSELLHQVFPGDKLQRVIAFQIGEHATVTCLQEMAYILRGPEQACECVPGSHDNVPMSDISRSLEHAVRGYEWQGRTTRFGRCHYLMGLLKEILGDLDLDTPDFCSHVLRTELAAAACACIRDNHIALGTDAKLVVGEWATHRFLREVDREGHAVTDKVHRQVLKATTAHTPAGAMHMPSAAFGDGQ